MEEFTTQVKISFELDIKEIALNLLDCIDEEIDRKLPDYVNVNDLFKRSIYKRVIEEMEQAL